MLHSSSLLPSSFHQDVSCFLSSPAASGRGFLKTSSSNLTLELIIFFCQRSFSLHLKPSVFLCSKTRCISWRLWPYPPPLLPPPSRTVRVLASASWCGGRSRAFPGGPASWWRGAPPASGRPATAWGGCSGLETASSPRWGRMENNRRTEGGTGRKIK